MTQKVNLYRCIWPFCLYDFFSGLIFFTPIWILFYQLRGMNLEQIGIFASALYLSSFIFEYPTGIFADRFGRKKSLVISIFLLILVYIIEISSYSFERFFVAAIIAGLGWSFSSGAREALVYDFLKEKKLEKYNSKVVGIEEAIYFFSLAVSAFFGSIMFKFDSTLPYWVTIVAMSFGILSLFFIKEAKYKKRKIPLTSLQQFKEGISNVLKNPVLLSLLLLYIPIFFFYDAWFNANQPILVSLGLPLTILGVYQMFRTIIGALGGLFLPKMLNYFSHRTLLMSIIVIQVIAWVTLGSNNLWFVIIFSFIFLLLRQLWNYVDADIIHKHIKSDVRASTLSARQMMISGIWIFIPWLMGYLVNTYNRNILFPIFGGIILLVAFPIYLARKKHF